MSNAIDIALPEEFKDIYITSIKSTVIKSTSFRYCNRYSVRIALLVDDLLDEEETTIDDSNKLAVVDIHFSLDDTESRVLTFQRGITAKGNKVPVYGDKLVGLHGDSLFMLNTNNDTLWLS